MNYLKRFCFAIVSILTIFLMIVSIVFLLATFPLTGLIYYVLTGKDPIDEEFLGIPVGLSCSFIEWYKNKFGPK